MTNDTNNPRYTPKSAPKIWGHIYRILDYITVGGLRPNEINGAAETPLRCFAPLHARVIRTMPSWAEERLTKLMGMLDTPGDAEERLSVEDQGKFFLGYYHEWARIEEKTPAKKNTAGRPPKGSANAVDWSDVDWTRTNAEISRDKGVAPQVVASQRKRHAPDELK